MQAARWRRVLGHPMMTPYESGLAAALAPEHVPEPEQLKAEILSIYAKFNLFDGTVHQRAALHLHLDGLLAKLATKAMPTQMIKTDRVTVEHSSSVDAVGGGLAVDKRRAHITLKQNAAQDRAYIESCFGRSLYPPERGWLSCRPTATALITPKIAVDLNCLFRLCTRTLPYHCARCPQQELAKHHGRDGCM